MSRIGPPTASESSSHRSIRPKWITSVTNTLIKIVFTVRTTLSKLVEMLGQSALSVALPLDSLEVAQ